MKKLGFGLMRLPLRKADDAGSVDLDAVCKMVDLFLERGFTYFDTAYMYHNSQSEAVLRESLVKRHPRESFTVATKLPVMFLKQKEDVERIFEEQLEKCGVSYFDYYMLHSLNASYYRTAEKFDAFSFLEKKKAEGKIKQIGFSYHDGAELLDEILTKHPEVDFVQLQINYIDWDDESIQSGKCHAVAVKHHKNIIVMEPVKGGTLAQLPEQVTRVFHEMHPHMSDASWAIRYAASLQNVIMVLSGMSNWEQLIDNTEYMREFMPLSAEEQTVLRKAVETLRASIAIPCTACGYCVAGCPQNIPIPKYFSLYNKEKHNLGKGDSTQRASYETYAPDYGKASECIGCGQCETACPQHLQIIEGLKSVAEVFE